MTARTGPYLPETGDAIIEIRASRLREMAAERQGLQDRLEHLLTLCTEFETYATRYPDVPTARLIRAIRHVAGATS